jgi:TatD DNase family protein
LNLDFLHSAGIRNVHTHNALADESAIYNILPQDFSNFQFKEKHYYSAGIHPWYIDFENIAAQFSKLQALLEQRKNILLIGECGLDKLKGPIIQIQEEVFEKHLVLAEEFQKPIIIHCVKAFQEVLSIIKKEKFSMPFIFHGFNKSIKLAKQIIEAGGSVSLNFNMNNEKRQMYLNALPKKNVFFETDDIL